MQATLTFPKRIQAEAFAKAWSRFSMSGHTICAGLENVKVIVYGVEENHKNWINQYILINHSK